jgi:hypothetical protein
VIGSTDSIRRNAHAYRSIPAKVDQIQWLDHFDLGARSTLKVLVSDRKASKPPIAAVTKHRFEEANSKRGPEVDDAEPLCLREGDTRVAEAARPMAKAQGVGVSREI